MDSWDTRDPQEDEGTSEQDIPSEGDRDLLPPEGDAEAPDRGAADAAGLAEDSVREAPGPEDAAGEEDLAEEGGAEAEQWPASRLPWEVADSVAAGAVNGREPAPQSAPASLPEVSEEPLPPAGRSRAVPVLIALVALIASLAGGAVYFFHTQAQQRKEALVAAVQAVSLTASPEFADTIQQRLGPIRQAIDDGKYAEASNRLKHIMKDVAPAEGGPGAGGGGLPGGVFGGPATGPGGPQAAGAKAGAPKGPPGAQPSGAPAEASELPPAAMAFFEANPELAQTVGQANMAGLKLKEMGGNVGRLRQIRGAIIEAARLHDKDKVIALLGDFQKELQAQASRLGPRPGRMPGRSGMRPGGDRRGGRVMPPRELMALVQQVNSEMQRAQGEGRDLRKAAGLMQQAERAGAAGHFQKATELTREALAAIRSAPKLPPQPELFSNPLVAMFLNLLHVEDQELATTLAALRQTLAEADDAAIAGLKAALSKSADTLAKVGARRRAFSKRLQEIRGGAKPSPQEQKQAAQRTRERVDEARAELAQILAKSRDLTPEQFARERDRIVDSILETVFGPPATTTPGGSRLVRMPTTEERVRGKLLSASDPYLEVLGDPERKGLADTTGELFRRARAHLAAQEYEQAEDLVDEGLKLLGVPVEPRPREPEAPTPPDASAEPSAAGEPQDTALQAEPAAGTGRPQPAAGDATLRAPESH